MFKFLIIILSLAFSLSSCKQQKTDTENHNKLRENTNISTPTSEPKPESVPENKPQLPKLPKPESIAREVTNLMHAYNNGNPDILINKTHPAIFDELGGKEKYKTIARNGVKKIMTLGIKIDSFVATPPNQFYTAGEEEICFVLTNSIMTLMDKKFQVQSFILAAGSEKAGWKYLDGAGLTISPHLLQKLFPKLSKDITLPLHKLTPIEEQSNTKESK